MALPLLAQVVTVVPGILPVATDFTMLSRTFSLPTVRANATTYVLETTMVVDFVGGTTVMLPLAIATSLERFYQVSALEICHAMPAVGNCLHPLHQVMSLTLNDPLC